MLKADEEQALRYVAGNVPMKLIQKAAKQRMCSEVYGMLECDVRRERGGC